MKAFFTIKRNIANGTPWTTRKNLYRSYIVPILSYGAVLWKPSKIDLKSIESIQMKASKWILGISPLEYKERLRRINLLPLALYHEMHVLLLFIQIVLNTYDLEWQKFVQLEEGRTRMKEIGVFKTRKNFKQKQASDFWMRVAYLANLFGNYIGTNVNELQSPKTMISNVYFIYFEKSFDPGNVCKWRVSCLCTDCRNIQKLDFDTKDLGKLKTSLGI